MDTTESDYWRASPFIKPPSIDFFSIFVRLIRVRNGSALQSTVSNLSACRLESRCTFHQSSSVLVFNVTYIHFERCYISNFLGRDRHDIAKFINCAPMRIVRACLATKRRFVKSNHYSFGSVKPDSCSRAYSNK